MENLLQEKVPETILIDDQHQFTCIMTITDKPEPGKDYKITVEFTNLDLQSLENVLKLSQEMRSLKITSESTKKYNIDYVVVESVKANDGNNEIWHCLSDNPNLFDVTDSELAD